MKPLNFQTQHFSGPLDLLLNLLDEKELNIGELAISEVTEQYLQYLDQMNDVNPEELADFLVVAARLLLSKSRQLLPQFGDEEDEGPVLEDQLRLYKMFVEASKKLNEKWLDGNRSFPHSEPARKQEMFELPTNCTLETLRESMVQLVSRLEPPKPIGRTHIDRAVSLKETVDRIRDFLKRKNTMQFSEVLTDASNKTEVIMGFIALLELVKANSVLLKQDKQFSDIIISRA